MLNHEPVNVLLVDDDKATSRHIAGTLELDGSFSVKSVETLALAEAALSQETFGTIILTLAPSYHPGLAAVALIQAIAPRTPLIVIAAEADEPIALKAVHQGAVDYLIRSQIYDTVIVGVEGEPHQPDVRADRDIAAAESGILCRYHNQLEERRFPLLHR